MENAVLSSRSRRLMWLSAGAFGLVGLILFVAPAWAAANFLWSISPMVAMTMGGWYLGSAGMAGLVAYHRRWNLIYGTLLYVGTFGLAEIAVLSLHSDRLKLSALLAWPYIAMLVVAVLALLSALVDWTRQRPRIVDEGAPMPMWARALVAAFSLFVFFLAAVALRGSASGQYGEIFPEPLSLFTLRSFGAFYLSLALTVLPFLGARRLGALTLHTQGGLALLITITAAALVHLGTFNFALYPRQVIYLGVYVVAIILVAPLLWYAHVRNRAAARG